jgi:hypothetical protein
VRKLQPQELATILCALRSRQDMLTDGVDHATMASLPPRVDVTGECDHFDGTHQLSAQQIDALCETINGSALFIAHRIGSR